MWNALRYSEGGQLRGGVILAPVGVDQPSVERAKVRAVSALGATADRERGKPADQLRRIGGQRFDPRPGETFDRLLAGDDGALGVPGGHATQPPRFQRVGQHLGEREGHVSSVRPSALENGDGVDRSGCGHGI